MRAQKSTFRPQSGQLSFHSTNIPRSMMEATSANAINRVLTTGATPPMPWADQDLGLGEQMGSNHQGTTGASVHVANRAARPGAPPGASRLRPTRVRGARGDASARARGERSARSGDCAGAVRRRRRRARQTEAVWAAEGGRQAAAAPQSQGDARASRRRSR